MHTNTCTELLSIIYYLYALNHTCSQSRESISQEQQQISQELDWTLLQTGYGEVASNTRILTCASLTPRAASNRQTNLSQCYKKHKNTKKCAYESRIQEIEHSSFTPLVMSSTGGLGPASTSTYKRLATLLAAKWDQPYTSTINWLRCRLSFSLLRSSIQAIRGARSTAGKASKAIPLPIDQVILLFTTIYHVHVY